MKPFVFQNFVLATCMPRNFMTAALSVLGNTNGFKNKKTGNAEGNW